MTGAASMITHPIALCAYVLSLVFGLLAKMWSSKGRKTNDRQLFRLAVFVSVTALFGGLVLAWYQTSRTSSTASEPAAKSAAPGNSSGGVTSVPVVSQSSSGSNSPNVQSSGSGSVSVTIAPVSTEPPKPAEKKK